MSAREAAARSFTRTNVASPAETLLRLHFVVFSFARRREAIDKALGEKIIVIKKSEYVQDDEPAVRRREERILERHEISQRSARARPIPGREHQISGLGGDVVDERAEVHEKSG